MKITILLPLLITLMCGALLAEPMDVNGRFQSRTPGGFPDGWAIHEWGGDQPFPAVKTIPDADGGNTALSISNVLGDDGGASKTFRAGEDVDAGETVIGGVSGGEWLKYTVHVNRTTNYTFTLEYGTPSPKQRGPKLVVDCKAIADFETPAQEFPDWRHTSKAVLKSVPLSAGDHEIVLLTQGSYNLGALNVEVE